MEHQRRAILGHEPGAALPRSARRGSLRAGEPHALLGAAAGRRHRVPVAHPLVEQRHLGRRVLRLQQAGNVRDGPLRTDRLAGRGLPHLRQQHGAPSPSTPTSCPRLARVADRRAAAVPPPPHRLLTVPPPCSRHCLPRRHGVRGALDQRAEGGNFHTLLDFLRRMQQDVEVSFLISSIFH